MDAFDTPVPPATTKGVALHDHLLTEQQVAAMLNLKVATLRRWRWARKNLPFRKLGGAVRYHPDDIAYFLSASQQAPNSLDPHDDPTTALNARGRQFLA